MIDAAAKALTQLFSRPFRRVLLKSTALALIVIVVAAIALDRLLVWLSQLGQNWAESTLGPTVNVPLTVLAWVLSIAAGLGVIVGSILLMPAVTSLVASFFVDDIAEQVERRYYPDEAAGRALPFFSALAQGLKTSVLAVLVYLMATPFLLLAGVGAVIFFLATSYLLGREYFELAAMRYRPPAEARALRKANHSTVFLAGMFIAAFVSIPIINLATPLFGIAFMVHMHKRLSPRSARPLIEIDRSLD